MLSYRIRMALRNSSTETLYQIHSRKKTRTIIFACERQKSDFETRTIYNFYIIASHFEEKSVHRLRSMLSIQIWLDSLRNIRLKSIYYNLELSIGRVFVAVYLNICCSSNRWKDLLTVKLADGFHNWY